MHYRQYQSRRSGLSHAAAPAKTSRVGTLALATGVAVGLLALPGVSSLGGLPLSPLNQQELTDFDADTSQLAASSNRPPTPASTRKPIRCSSPKAPVADSDSDEWETEGFVDADELSPLKRYKRSPPFTRRTPARSPPPPRLPLKSRALTGRLPSVPEEGDPNDLVLWNVDPRDDPPLTRRERLTRQTQSMPAISEHTPVSPTGRFRRRNAIVPQYREPDASSDANASSPSSGASPPSSNFTRSERRLLRRFAPFWRRAPALSTAAGLESGSDASSAQQPIAPIARMGGYIKGFVNKAAKSFSAGRSLLPQRVRRYTPLDQQYALKQEKKED